MQINTWGTHHVCMSFKYIALQYINFQEHSFYVCATYLAYLFHYFVFFYIYQAFLPVLKLAPYVHTGIFTQHKRSLDSFPYMCMDRRGKDRRGKDMRGKDRRGKDRRGKDR